MSLETLAEQVKFALKQRGHTTKDLAELLGLSLRQTQHRLKENNLTTSQIEAISTYLNWDFQIQLASTTLNEPGSSYMANRPITFAISVDGSTANKLPGLVQEIEEVIKRRMG